MGEPIIIAGGGIGGLTTALTLHEIGVPVRVFESSMAIRPLGVGINLQPNAVRERTDLGLADRLPDIGVEAEEWALVGRNGNDVWAELRGRRAGYRWPQFAVHRGELQMLLLDTVRERCGSNSVIEAHRLRSYEQTAHSVTATFEDRGTGRTVTVEGPLLVAADGLHSAARRQRFPDEGPPLWGGAVLWRGTALGRPIRTGASFTLVGNLEQRFVHYPIGPWIPPLDSSGRTSSPNSPSTLPRAGMLRAGTSPSTPRSSSRLRRLGLRLARHPGAGRSSRAGLGVPDGRPRPGPDLARWPGALLGDAAHVMYPVGSNGRARRSSMLACSAPRSSSTG